ncbi:MAG: redox-regulated ATPase YchF [bacterium]|nr:redox-regulated ATPase YchF [bacterium]
MLKVGIVGLPNVGKSTLFNALLKKQVAASANYPFTTIEPNVGVVEVPDGRLEKLAQVVKTEKIIPAAVEFVDIAGLVKGAAEGEGLGNKFLSHIREVDAIAHVVRAFEDPNVLRSDSSTDPKNDVETINTELILADLETVTKLIDGAERELKGMQNAELRAGNEKLKTLKKIKSGLDQGVLAKGAELTKEELEAVGPLPLITIKPTIYVYNVSEADLNEELNPSRAQGLLSSKVRIENLKKFTPSVVICAKVEAELAELSAAEQKDYLQELGVDQSGLERLIRESYELLGLITYFTAGEKEARAWTIKKGTKAPTAAGVIHTDFERGFIKAEVINWEKLVEAPGWNPAREKGWVALVGKDYLFQDGDTAIFKFNT